MRFEQHLVTISTLYPDNLIMLYFYEFSEFVKFHLQIQSCAIFCVCLFFILHIILYFHPCCSKRPNFPLHRWVIFLFSPYVSYFLYVLIHLNSHLFLYTAIMENDAINMTNQIFSGFDFISFEFIFKTGSSVWILEKALLFKVTYILPQWSTLVDFSLDAYP